MAKRDKTDPRPPAEPEPIPDGVNNTELPNEVWIPAPADKQTPPTPLTPQGGRVPSLWAAPDLPPSQWPTNYDLSTVEGRAGLINAGRPADWQPQDGGTYEICATHFVAYPDEIPDEETGELKPVSRICLIGADGRMIKFASEFMHRKTNALFKMFLPHEWAQGIRLECYTAKSRRPGRTPYGAFRVLGLGPKKD